MWERLVLGFCSVLALQDLACGRMDAGEHSLSTPVRPSASSGAARPVNELPPLGLFGFRRADLPAPLGFELSGEKPTERQALLFSLRAFTTRGRVVTRVGIDDAGNVVEIRSNGVSTQHVALGRVDARVLADQVRLARSAAARALAKLPPSCFDCGGATIDVAASSQGEPTLVLASDGEQCTRATGEGEKVVAWFLAVLLATHRTFWAVH